MTEPLPICEIVPDFLKKDDYLAQRMGNSSKNDSKCTTEAVM